MSNSLQQFLARAVPKATEDLAEAIEQLPEDKRNWRPSGAARTALDQAAEVAILNGNVANTLRTKEFNQSFMSEYEKVKADLVAQGWPAVKALMGENTQKVAQAIGEVSESDFGFTIEYPWGTMSLEQIMSYPYWNACYHEGQVTYIRSLLGPLDN